MDSVVDSVVDLVVDLVVEEREAGLVVDLEVEDSEAVTEEEEKEVDSVVEERGVG